MKETNRRPMHFSSPTKVAKYLEGEGFNKGLKHPQVGEYLIDKRQRAAVVVKGPKGVYILSIFENEEAMITDFQVRSILLENESFEQKNQ